MHGRDAPMTGAQGRGEVAAYLLSLAGPDLYTRNAFLISGLATDADARAVREQRQRLTTKAATGDALAVTALAAIDELRDERHRIAHEIFRDWPGKPTNSCGCPHSVHATHTLAVRAHAEALRLEQAGQTGSADQQWGDAATAWQNLLRHIGFWDHLRYRISQLGDRRMNEATIAEIRDVLPTVLAKPIVELAVAAKSPARLVKRAPAWNFDAQAATDLMAEATQTLMGTIEDVLGKARDDLEADRALKVAETLLEDAVPKARRLNQLMPSGEHRSTAQMLDQVAILLNNCALAIGEQPSSRDSATVLFDTALALVTTPSQRKLIANNAAADKQRRAINADLAQFGLTVEDDGFAKLGDRLTHCLSNGKLAEARRILTVMRNHATDPVERRQIDQLLNQVGRVSMGQGLSFARPDDDHIDQRRAFTPSGAPADGSLPTSWRMMERGIQISAGVGWVVPIMFGTWFGFWWGVLACAIYVLGAVIAVRTVRK
ncbi:MAG TPA: hypothetical protein VGM75_13220 [Pseudonocardiaceae bacterium]